MLRNDVEAVVSQFVFPLSFIDGNRTVVLNDEDKAARAIQMLWMLYEDMGMASIETLWMGQHRISSDFVLADVTWRLLDSNGAPICDQRSTYAIRGVGEAARIVSVCFHEDNFPRHADA
jgi:hypothetical protein